MQHQPRSGEGCEVDRRSEEAFRRIVTRMAARQPGGHALSSSSCSITCFCCGIWAGCFQCGPTCPGSSKRKHLIYCLEAMTIYHSHRSVSNQSRTATTLLPSAPNSNSPSPTSSYLLQIGGQSEESGNRLSFVQPTSFVTTSYTGPLPQFDPSGSHSVLHSNT